MGKNNFNNSWKNRDDNKIKAEYHTIKMEKEYKEDIDECVENTFTYDDSSVDSTFGNTSSSHRACFSARPIIFSRRTTRL